MGKKCAQNFCKLHIRLISRINVLNFHFFSADKENYRFAMYCFSVLVKAWNMKKFVKCLKLCKVVFCSKYIHKSTKEASATLVELFYGIGIKDDIAERTDEVNEEDEYGLIKDDEAEKVTNLKKPFGSYFEMQLSNVIIPLPDAETESKKNPLYQPHFMEQLQANWLSMAPFWSELLRGKHIISSGGSEPGHTRAFARPSDQLLIIFITFYAINEFMGNLE